jgi:hypothetical protein
MIIFFETAYLFFLLVMALWLVFVYLFTRRLVLMFLRGEAPFVPSDIKRSEEIAEALDVGKEDIFYDLGSGDARILVACYQAQPQAEYVGFEKDIIPYLWSKLRLWRMGLLKKITVYRRDFFHEDFSKATHIFTYLGSKQMDKLETKLEKELKKGAKLVSLKFKLPKKLPSMDCKLDSKDLYVYEF